MARYDVHVTMKQVFTFAIEAGSPVEAQNEALAQMGNLTPENMEIEITVNRGVK